jgi:cell division protease FtsH
LRPWSMAGRRAQAAEIKLMSDKNARNPDERDRDRQRPLGQRRRSSQRGPRQTPLSTPPARPLRTLAFWVVVLLLAVAVYQFYNDNRIQEVKISYSDFRAQVDTGNIKSVTYSATREVHGELRKEAVASVHGRRVPYTQFYVMLPLEDETMLRRLEEKNPDAEIVAEPERFSWMQALITWLPIILIIAFWLFVIRQIQAGGSTALKFGKSRAKVLLEDHPKVTFEDVAGADEAKQELEEVIEFLRDPKKFQTLGGRIPKGALLLGAPGTGKTLLARAVAGEAGVPFFSMSGSDFVEMFVGVGASRVRDLFEQGKKSAPCIIFIDEIDAVGRHRGAGLGGGHDEREQTLNQLLVEMDGFESNDGVILIAATNRPDVLDPALLRPGRFDRQIVVDRPDIRGREGILRVHTKNIPLAADVDLEVLARGTPGLAGADLANLVNEAALLAARRNRQRVTMRDFEDSKDKVMLGTERRSLVISDREKRSTAYHESGHALVAWLQPGTDPIHKATIIPRGRALGLVYQLPTDDRYNDNRDQMGARLAILMGGRAAEQLVLGQQTSGAANDIRMATEVARRMVCEWGMSDKLGPIAFGKREELVFLGREISQSKDYSESTAQVIDEEVRRLVEEAEERAKSLLSQNVDKLHMLANTLLEREIMDGDEITRLLNGETLDPLPPKGNNRPADGEKAAVGDAGESEPGSGDGGEPTATGEGQDGQGETADEPSRARSTDGDKD